jgi:hypothetical protein
VKPDPSASFHHSATIHAEPRWAFLLIVALLLVALVIVARVLIASRHSLVIWKNLNAAFSVLIWVVPAIAVVFLIGVRSLRPTGIPASPSAEAGAIRESQVADRPAKESGRILPPRLRVRRISAEDPRLSVSAGASHDPNQFSLSSERYATLEEAEIHLTDLALGRVRELCAVETPDIAAWLSSRFAPGPEILIDLINQHGVKELAGEVMDWDFKNGTRGKMYRAHLWFDFSPGLRDALHRRWEADTAERRLILLGSLLGLVTLMLGTAAGYFRLDDATGGAFRGRLKLAALAVVAAGSVAAAGAIGS